MATQLQLVSKNLDFKKLVIPEVYQRAVQLIRETIDIDEAKQWVDKSEALIAWAHMYNQNELGEEAKRLRLHAFKRMGTLAGEIQPTKVIRGGGRQPGPVALLIEAGLSRHNASAAVYLSKLTGKAAKKIIDIDKPLAPQTYERRSHKVSSLAHYRNLQRSPFSCRQFLQETTPQQAVDSLSPEERKRAVKQMRALGKWVTEFVRLCKSA